MPNKLDEILKKLTGTFQNTSHTKSLKLSPVRKKALVIFSKVNKLAARYTKHQTFTGIINTIIVPRIENLIKKVIPENELKQILKDCYDETREIYNELDIATELKNTPTDKTINDEVKKLPRYKELGELLS